MVDAAASRGFTLGHLLSVHELQRPRHRSADIGVDVLNGDPDDRLPDASVLVVTSTFDEILPAFGIRGNASRAEAMAVHASWFPS